MPARVFFFVCVCVYVCVHVEVRLRASKRENGMREGTCARMHGSGRQVPRAGG
jgi:hypothetical protein